MFSFVMRRLLQATIALFVLGTVVFFMFRLLPSDPTIAMADADLTPEALATINKSFGLDKPLYCQYYLYFKNVLVHGDFGTSFFYRKPVMTIIGEKTLNTLILGITGVVLAYAIGTLLGALLAWYRGTLFEIGGITTGLVAKAAPQFWVAMVLIMIFSFKLGWLPHGGLREIGYSADTLWEKYMCLDFLLHLILPTTVLALYFLALPMLLMRNSMLEVKYEDFVELAYSKGLPMRRIIFHHAARNALLPVATSFALSLGRSIGGAVLVEYVFSWPGLGREIILAATRYDYPLAQASFLIIAAVVMIMNLLADLLYGLLDPRIVYK